MIVSLDQELENVGQDLVNVHVHYLKDRETLLHKFVGSLLREKREKEGAIPVAQLAKMLDVLPYGVPKYTPTVKFFLIHDVKNNGSSRCGLFAIECREFMCFSNADRLKVFFQQRRCFGFFLPVAVAGHARLRDCKHPRYCTVCKSGKHYQWMCGPSQTYQGRLPHKRRHVNVGLTAGRRFPLFLCLFDLRLSFCILYL